MRTDEMRPSDNVEDRRGMSAGGGGPRLIVGGGIGSVILIALYLLMGGNPQALLSGGGSAGGGSSSSGGSPNASLANDPQAQLATRVLGDTEDVWTKLFKSSGEHYTEPKLILFSGAVDSACGFAQSAVGPFYCPGDSDVYLDLDFFKQLETEFHASGDFAQAYV